MEVEITEQEELEIMKKKGGEIEEKKQEEE